MQLRRISLENVRSFLDKQELFLDGQISIIIGPNGGGKTNLLDSIVISLRRYLQSPTYFAPEPTLEKPHRHVLRHNDILANMLLDKHSSATNRSQIIEVDLEVTKSDIENLILIKNDKQEFLPRLDYYLDNKFSELDGWDIDLPDEGQIFTFTIKDSMLTPPQESKANTFYKFIFYFELLSALRTRLGYAELTLPILYLPINRSAHGFQSNISLSSYNDVESKRQSDASHSRQGFSLVTLAIGRLATKYRMLQEDDSGKAKERLHNDPSLVSLSNILKKLGYDWDLECINPMTNQYDISLIKQGVKFNVNAASSGEKELLNYVFTIHILKIKDALIIVDEPELHLHPRWQIILLELFEDLANKTGNQFLLATHSPAFVSPQSIQYISRVYSKEQRSFITRLNKGSLPNIKHLFNIINSQNNEKIFFADKVVLVEGISDRIVFNSLLKSTERKNEKVIEIVNIGGKGFFDSYSKILKACEIDFSIIADQDYIEQIGSVELKSLFKLNASEIKKDVIDNVTSLDGSALVLAIDNAIKNKSWVEANDIWDYIKSRRRMLAPELSEVQSHLLNSFIYQQREIGIFILSLGALEQYLPIGYRKKDLEKIILLSNNENIWDIIAAEGKDEIKTIIDSINK